jgi:ADP-heptose:LPS heptosyltransferase
MTALAAAADLRSARVERIGVFRALQLGDMLCLLPALRSLRAGFPDAEVTLVGLPWAREFAARFAACVDRFVEFPGHPAMPERVAAPAQWPAYLAAVRAARFDLALQWHGSGSLSNGLVADWGARLTAGFRPRADRAAPAGVFLPWDEREHEVLRYLRLTRHLGLPAAGTQLEWPEAAADVAEIEPILERAAGRRFVVVHPGARLGSRRWPVERFAALGDALAAAGWPVLVTGAASEAELTARMVAGMRRPALDLAGRTSLGGLAALLRRAALLVCNDTGVSHVAAAVGAPSVVVCCGADPGRWAPLDRRRHAVLYAQVECRPCMHAECPVGHACALRVDVAAVVECALGKLRAHGPKVGTSEVMA